MSAERMDQFLESLKAHRAASTTVAARGSSLRVFFRWLERRPSRELRDVTQDIVLDYQAWLLSRYALSSVHVHLIALRRFFEFLESIDAVLINPCIGLPLPKKSDRLPRTVLSVAEAQRILAVPDTSHPKGLRDRAILETFYSTGIRLEEMAGLHTDDVNLSDGLLRVNCGKFAKDRVVPLGTEACTWLKRYLERARDKWTSNGADQPALWLSWRRPHDPIKKQVIAVMVRSYGRQAGIRQRVTPHVWRHTCATHLMANGSDLAHVQRLLGHRSLSTTQLYTRVTIPELKQTCQRVERAADKNAVVPELKAIRKLRVRPMK